MQNRERRISDIVRQIDQLSSELSELLTLQEQTRREEVDQTPPVVAYLAEQQEPDLLGVGDTVKLIGPRDRHRGKQGEIVKVTAKQFAIRLFDYPDSPRPFYRNQDKVTRVVTVASRTSQ